MRPGTTLLEVTDVRDDAGDDAAVAIIAGLARGFFQPAREVREYRLTDVYVRWIGFLQEHFGDRPRDQGPFPATVVDRVLEILRGPLAEPPAEPGHVRLHADLHHLNVLAADTAASGWVAIDPKGWIGERAYELASGSYCNVHTLVSPKDVRRRLARRLDAFADLTGVDRQRLKAWTTVKSLLSAWWMYRSGEERWVKVLGCTDALLEM